MLAADTRGLGKHSDYVLIVFVLSLSWVGSGSEESFINLLKIKLHSDSQMQKYFEVLLYLCHWVYLGIIVIAADPRVLTMGTSASLQIQSPLINHHSHSL